MGGGGLQSYRQMGGGGCRVTDKWGGGLQSYRHIWGAAELQTNGGGAAKLQTNEWAAE